MTMMIGHVAIITVLLLQVVVLVQGFVPSLPRHDLLGGIPQTSSAGPKHTFPTTATTTTTNPLRNSRLFVFERMSEECIGAIVTAQKQAEKFQQKQVQLPCLMVGVVDMPETAALERTFKQYGVTYRKAVRALDDAYPGADSESNKGIGSFFKSRDPDNDLPFGPDVQKTLKRAGSIADSMDSTAIQTQHLFLSMMEYQPGDSVVGKEPKAVTDSTENGALFILKTIDPEITALDMCESLVGHIEEMGSDNVDNRELVTGVGGPLAMKTLDECGVDLTKQATDGLLDPVQGRDKEINSCIRTLVRRRKNNVCLIGEAGVGKTSIVEAIAQVLVAPNCPPRMKGTRLVSLELANLVAGTKYRGEFEERLQAIVEELTDPKAPPTILFIDEIHNLVGAGAAEGGMDAANLLKPALARGELQLIGATTIAEYRKYIEKDAALERRLQPVMVKEPSVPETVEILRTIAPSYEKHHRVRYTPESLATAAKLSERYLTDRFLPDKAIDLMDEAGAIAHLQGYSERVQQTESDLDSDDDDSEDQSSYPVVDEHTVAEVISEWASIPLGKLESSEMDRLVQLEDDMTLRVKGQNRAIQSVSRAVRRARSGLRDPQRPIASFMFCGPTGTGKTELCKTLAETYFGSEKDMIRIDCSEYMEKHSVSRLTGPPPGYIGFDDGGYLTEAVRRSPHSVVLLDELEKAHGDVLNILLQILEDGILTDGKGRTVNFKNTILIMTSNVGSKRILELSRLESKLETDDSSLYEKLSETVKEELEATMKPELLNRMDEIVIFSPLSDQDLSSITDLILKKIATRAESEQELTLTVGPALSRKVMEEGSSNAAQFGARPMRRAAQRFFEDAISDALVRGFLQKGDDAVVDLKDDDSTSRQYAVEVRKPRDNTSLDVLVDKASKGIGSTQSSSSSLQNTGSSFDDDYVDSVATNGESLSSKKKRRPSTPADVEVDPVQ
eukprot:CAMPEP_0113514930 /NCGR_PEP_ID=MMETSP0014_2-20120614/40671_1 /TAXON_ID=2857 /ORGANISM="Nitzschia sp." /LENGTH=957 /DNA_ID=CAMNT_0000411459 /DNA_START=189 /DNA_END=3062 /DNA_ORIENTATION=- /assembly_acc=CAM_ASM_000159